MTVRWAIVAAMLIAIVPATAQRPHPADDTPGHALRARIRANADRAISFDRRFVQSFVPCGTGCGSYWFVDRRRGQVIAAPDESGPGETVLDIATRRDSAIVRVRYIRQDGTGPCRSRLYRRTQRGFVPHGPRRRSGCDPVVRTAVAR